MTDHTGSPLASRTIRSRVLVVAGVLLGALVAAMLLAADRSGRAEADRLAELLSLRDGMTVAEIGAGSGWLTVEVADRVGSRGRVYSTELSAARLEDIRQAVDDAGLTNVVVLEAGERATNLPADCCEAIFMRRVYHHLSDPSAILASIQEALKSGGRLVIIEFSHSGLLGTVTQMGIDRADLIAAVSRAGFEVVATDEWPGWNHYVAVFDKAPGPL